MHPCGLQWLSLTLSSIQTKGLIMKYQSIFDIWAVPADLLKHVQAGQMVYAGDKSNKGRFLGVRKSGSIVVALGSLERAPSAVIVMT